jgi:hypothetical protein
MRYSENVGRQAQHNGEAVRAVASRPVRAWLSPDENPGRVNFLHQPVQGGERRYGPGTVGNDSPPQAGWHRAGSISHVAVRAISHGCGEFSQVGPTILIVGLDSLTPPPPQKMVCHLNNFFSSILTLENKPNRNFPARIKQVKHKKI